MIKFECLDNGEVQAAGNDKWINPALSPATLANYKKINFANHAVRSEATNLPLWNAVPIAIDLNIVTFKDNFYERNFGSDAKGLIDIRGAPRVKFSGETFTKNGDSGKEIKDEYPITQVPPSSNDMQIYLAYANSGNIYGSEKLMKSLIHIERSSQLIMTDMIFEYNWLIENTCTGHRA